jgi:hypothetical protein
MKIANRTFQNVAQFKHMGTTVAIQNLIQEEIKRRLNSDNDCYYSIPSLVSSRLLSKNVKSRICKIIILPVILYECETWSLTLRELPFFAKCNYNGKVKEVEMGMARSTHGEEM